MSLIQNIKISRVSNASAAAQTDVTGATLDMNGFAGVVFVALLGDVTDTSALTLSARGGQQSGGGDAALLDAKATYAAGASDADNKAIVLDLVSPRYRYLSSLLTRKTANAAVDGVIAIQYRPGFAPTARAASVVASAFVNDPDPA